MSTAEPRCGRDRAVHEIQSLVHRLLQAATESEPGGNGR